MNSVGLAKKAVLHTIFVSDQLWAKQVSARVSWVAVRFCEGSNLMQQGFFFFFNPTALNLTVAAVNTPLAALLSFNKRKEGNKPV